MQSPLASVVIPAYNSERHLGEAIESALAQTYAPVEVIVVDDGSDDATAAVASGFGDRVRLIRQPNGGPSAARNAGFAASAGEFVAFHDADDVMTPDKLEVQLSHLLAHPEAGCVVGTQELMVEDGARLPYWAPGTEVPVIVPPGALGAETADGRQVHTMSMVVRREVFAEVGGFDETMRHGEDVDWLLKAIDHEVGVTRLADVVVRRRIHEDSITQDPVAGREAIFRVLKSRIERKRTAG